MSELVHYGVLGMKWGVRKDKYHNSDGSLTSLGKKKQEYDDVKKQYSSGYREYIGDGAFAVWPNKRAFNKAINARTKDILKQTKGLKNRAKVKEEAKSYKRSTDIYNMLISSAGKESAKRIKDSMKAEIKGIPVSQVTKGRQKTERVLTRVGLVTGSVALLAGYGFLEYKLGF